MADNFAAGEADAAGAGAPQDETMGARFAVRTNLPQRGEPEPRGWGEPVLMPSVTGKNDGYRPVQPAITQTPLGAMMPGQDMPPPQIDGQNYRAPVPDQANGFVLGLREGYPEGLPVPYNA